MQVAGVVEESQHFAVWVEINWPKIRSVVIAGWYISEGLILLVLKSGFRLCPLNVQTNYLYKLKFCSRGLFISLMEKATKLMQ
ncbi:unnamed protein product [Wuchereria bancrofti]|uniref:Uncharacterized protein n=1 Tax=Wuchereria bancrofti TaxID=6293 RepID=A0A3P7EYS5_WUCBA|nr:unnamed protein product [Wuchereria bancrofti]